MSPSMILNVILCKLIFTFFFSPNKVGELTEQMVGYNLITKQTPEDGVLVNKVNELNYIFVFLRCFKQSSQSSVRGGKLAKNIQIYWIKKKNEKLNLAFV